jgi:hypothetical protein
MKTRISKIFLMGCIAGSVYSQNLKALELQIGTLNPKGTHAAGLILGGSYGITIDERVDLSLGLAWFHKGYTKETEVGNFQNPGGSSVQTKKTELEYSTTLLPITANARIYIPFQKPLGFYVGGSLAYEILFDKYTNNELKKSEKSTYNSFGWIARAGLEFSIGSRSSITAEAFYNGCKVKGDKKKIDGIPTWNEVDVSGFGFRGGLRLLLY